MDAFIRAAHANPDVPHTLSHLWEQRPELRPHGLPARPQTVPEHTYAIRDEMARRGILLGERPAVEALWLLRVHRTLGVPGQTTDFARAVLAHALGSQTHTLFEVLHAVNEDAVSPELAAALQADARVLYAWVDGTFDPRRHFPEGPWATLLVPPHMKAYDALVSGMSLPPAPSPRTNCGACFSPPTATRPPACPSTSSNDSTGSSAGTNATPGAADWTPRR